MGESQVWLGSCSFSISMDAKMNEENKDKRHYVLVHGAWCWYKLKPQLQSSGNKVTVLDFAASGINPKRIEDVGNFAEYSEPLLELLESLPPSEKVVLVGNSFGGLSLALAMDKFPHKIALAVFVAAFVPDTQHPPSCILDEHAERNQTNGNGMLDNELPPSGSLTLFGPNFLRKNLYQLCFSEDLELANTLVRPCSLFLEELRKAKSFSKEGYGSVPVAYIVCKEDLAIPVEFQKWMVQSACIHEIVEITDADHMPMLSNTYQLCLDLLHLVNKYT
ncbi:salicylic acid-binding protein 2-like isoform X2 [Prosopis cineraria]|uniref:salicylic acid-binding protein 2-like isoform X2 n=1 Tax=Prosopis cineraria TaxID=364024 RepID=UPI00240F272E|nr:salicylic acid-binding protein 2-like isoform X2 [Prosopis cineraria]XP_054798140.1 salicylic acid-binding protein 2-like isoform X2 [Prosopis cineraria]XP_054798141.1 salicylic acid-binding protein 2-like isoform X2 [Prosopis cineraria]XP_054798142.1 salicylic acid-binding protein 2-like isoform X2 [Prosopis cineraria]XP_054798144.1 salicylic acid-binding protein 2-like isoform X2 [Prosopis cineraria]XP_054798145.1 salicylic acid-binding protein 2-like isoform X2 [Prosopis cineraria]